MRQARHMEQALMHNAKANADNKTGLTRSSKQISSTRNAHDEKQKGCNITSQLPLLCCHLCRI